MSAVKDLYIGIVEELMSEDRMSYDEASEKAHTVLRQRLRSLADRWDDEKDRQREMRG